MQNPLNPCTIDDREGETSFMHVTETHRRSAAARGHGRRASWYLGLLIMAAISGGSGFSSNPAVAGPGQSDAPTASAEPAAETSPPASRPAPAPKPAPNKAAPSSCPPAPAVPEFTSCEAVEITGAPPCEALCKRPRKVAPADKCCTDPVEVAVLSGTRVLLRVDACSFVPPECANVHGHGRMDARLRVLQGPQPELIVVEGGCEMRAVMHRYVPAGVAPWVGCRHVRYRWNGKELVKQ